MLSINQILMLLMVTFAAMIVSCTKPEPCEDVTCPTGFICDNGACIDDPNADPCLNVNCPEGYSCEDGECVLQGYQTEVLSGAIGSNTTWTSDKVYELAGKVIVPEGIILNIEPGTIIKGRSGSGSLASALIIARGGQIMAVGTAERPIIFTSVLDDIEPGELDGGNLTELNNETWGGLIILGSAPISAGNGDTEAQIEGIPADEEYGRYGGNDANDNSGILQYVSVRHGGALIGEGNEINGITLGGVGSGTTIDHIEVAATLDDGIEFFGGTVNVSNAIISYQGDDGVDIDQNYSGTVDNFVVIHGGDDTDEGLEIDGPEGSTYTDGKFMLKNGTLIAKDQIKTSAADFKSKAQGTITNCSWIGYAKFIKVRASFDPDNLCASKTDAYTRLISGDLLFNDNEIVGSIAAEEMTKVYSDDDPGENDCFLMVEKEYQTSADSAFTNGSNQVSSSASKGANLPTFDSWTLAAIRSWY